jgi:hypothetical protein
MQLQRCSCRESGKALPFAAQRHDGRQSLAKTNCMNSFDLTNAGFTSRIQAFMGRSRGGTVLFKPGTAVALSVA